MIFVICLFAQQTDAHLLVPAEKVQDPLMPLADSLLQVLHRVDQLVSHQGGNSLVRFQVGFAIRRHTHQARLHGFELKFCAHVALHLPRRISAFSYLHFSLLYLHRNLCNDHVCGDLWPPVESFITRRAVEQLTVVPALAEAGLAEVVTTRCGDRVTEDVQTDRTLEMILGQRSKD